MTVLSIKHNLALVAIATTIVIASGCGAPATSTTATDSTSGPSTAAKGKTFTVGFSQIGAESSWRTAETKSVQDEATKRGDTLKLSDAGGDQQKQILALRSFIQQKVDVIFLAPKVETGWEPVLKEVKAANIPVILLDRGITVSDPGLYKTLLTSDFVAEGQRDAVWMAKAMKGKGDLVEIQGTIGSAPANDRMKGFDTEIAKYPGIKITRSESGDFTLAKGKEVMEAFLKGDPNINAVFAHNDDMALGAIQAIQEAGKQPGTDILVAGIDGVRGAIQAISDGKMNVTTECNPLLGPAAFDAAEAVLAGKTIPQKIISKDNQYDSTTAKAALPTRKY